MDTFPFAMTMTVVVMLASSWGSAVVNLRNWMAGNSQSLPPDKKQLSTMKFLWTCRYAVPVAFAVMFILFWFDESVDHHWYITAIVAGFTVGYSLVWLRIYQRLCEM